MKFSHTCALGVGVHVTENDTSNTLLESYIIEILQGLKINTSQFICKFCLAKMEDFDNFTKLCLESMKGRYTVIDEDIGDWN